jgi:chitodextrinase
MKKLITILALLLFILAGCSTSNSGIANKDVETETDVVSNSEEIVYNKAGTYTTTTDQTVRVTVGDVELKDSVINGDLIIEESVGEGDVILDNVSLTGELIVRGGGKNSIKLRGNTTIILIIIEKKVSPVRIEAAEGVVVKEIQLLEKTATFIIDGKGYYGKLVLLGGKEVEIRKDVKIEIIEIEADNIEMNDLGEVVRIIVNADNVVINAKINDLDILGDVIGTIINGEEVKEGGYLVLFVEDEITPTPIPSKSPVISTVVEVNNAPTTPKDLIVVDSTYDTVNLEWTESTDDSAISKYEIYNGNIKVGSTKDTKYLVKSLVSETEYSFKVRAIDNGGKNSKYSDIVVATTTVAPVFDVIFEDGGKVEGYEDGKKITVDVNEDRFIESQVILNNIQIKGLPKGVTLSSVTYKDVGKIEILLKGNSTVDYDENLDLNIILSADMLVNVVEDINLESKLFAEVEAQGKAPIAALELGTVTGTKIININDTMEYKVTSGLSDVKTIEWCSVTKDQISIDNIDIELNSKIYVRYKALLRTVASKEQTLEVNDLVSYNFEGNFKNEEIGVVYVGHEDGLLLRFEIKDDMFVENKVLKENITLTSNVSAYNGYGVYIAAVRYLNNEEIEIELGGMIDDVEFIDVEKVNLFFELNSNMFEHKGDNYISEQAFVVPEKCPKPEVELSIGSDKGVKIKKLSNKENLVMQYMIKNELGISVSTWNDIAKTDFIVDNVEVEENYKVILRYIGDDAYLESDELVLTVSKFDLERLDLKVKTNKELVKANQNETILIVSSSNDNFVEDKVTKSNITLSYADGVSIAEANFISGKRIEIILNGSSFEDVDLSEYFLTFDSSIFDQFDEKVIFNLNDVEKGFSIAKPEGALSIEKNCDTVKVELTSVLNKYSLEYLVERSGVVIKDWEEFPSDYLIKAENDDLIKIRYIADIDSMDYNSDVTILIVDYKPTTPENIRSVNIDHNSISLVWDISTDNNLLGYDLYMDDKLVAMVESNSFLVEHLNYEKTYSFKVRATDLNGNYSEFSNIIDETTSLKPVISYTLDVENSGEIESEEDGKNIIVTVKNAEFIKSEVNLENVTITGLPKGISIGNVSYIDKYNISILLAGNSTVDYDENVTVRVILKSNLVDGETEDSIIDTELIAKIEESPIAPVAGLESALKHGVKLININDTMEIKFEEIFNEGMKSGEWISVADGETAIDNLAIAVDSLIYVRYKSNFRIPFSQQQQLIVKEDLQNNFALYFYPDAKYLGREDKQTLTLCVQDDTFIESEVKLGNISSTLGEGVSISEVEYVNETKLKLTLSGNYEHPELIMDEKIVVIFTLDQNMFANNTYKDFEVEKHFEKNVKFPAPEVKIIRSGNTSKVNLYRANEITWSELQYMVEDENGEKIQEWGIYPIGENTVTISPAKVGYKIKLRFYDSITYEYSDETELIVVALDLRPISCSSVLDRNYVEGNEDGLRILVSISGDKFVEENINIDNITFYYNPGVTVSDAEYISEDSIIVTLSGVWDNKESSYDYSHKINLHQEVFVGYDTSFMTDIEGLSASKYNTPEPNLQTVSPETVYLQFKEKWNGDFEEYKIEDPSGNIILDWSKYEYESVFKLTKGNIVKVRTNGYGLAFESEEALCTGLYVPSMPIGLKNENITSESIELSWDVPVDDVRVVSYDVYLNNVLVDTVMENSYNYINLSPNHSYTLNVVATDDEGNKSIKSHPQYVYTLVTE